MKRKYSDNELKQYFNNGIKGEKRDEMTRDILDDDQSFLYLASLWNEKYLGAATEISEASRKILGEIAAKYNHNGPEITKKTKPDQKDFGQIYRINLPLNWPQSQQELRLAMIVRDTENCYEPQMPDLLVMPVSFDTQYQSDEDVVISADDSPLKMEFMVRAGEAQPVFDSQIGEFYGTIPEKYDEAIRTAWKKSAGIIESDDETSDEQEAFAQQEREITDYVRRPVNSWMEIAEEYEDISSFDLSHLVLTELVEIQKEAEEPAEQAEIFAFILAAAAAVPTYDNLALGDLREFELHAVPGLNVRLMIGENGVYLQLHSKDEGRADLIIQEDDGTELLHKDDIQIAKLKDRPSIALNPLGRIINKIIQITVHFNNLTFNKRIRLYHAYVR
jgi:hypothetical protein